MICVCFNVESEFLVGSKNSGAKSDEFEKQSRNNSGREMSNKQQLK